MHKKYYLFAGDWYYPSGGFEDFIKRFNTKDEAKQYFHAIKSLYDWAHIVLIDNVSIIARYKQGAWTDYD